MIEAANAQARQQARMMAEHAAYLILEASQPDIDLLLVSSKLDQVAAKFKGEAAKIDILSLSQNSRQLVDNSLARWNLDRPSETVEETNLDGSKVMRTWEERVNRKLSTWVGKGLRSGGNLERDGDEWSYHGANDFRSRVFELASEAKSKGMTLQQFAGSLATSPEIEGSIGAQVADHLVRQCTDVQDRVVTRSEGLAMADYAHHQIAIGGPKLKRRYVKVVISKENCTCHQYNGHVYDMPGTPGSTEASVGPKLPIHPYCRCKYLPIVDSKTSRESDEMLEQLSVAIEQELIPKAVKPKKEGIIYRRGSGYLETHIDEPAIVAFPLGDIGSNYEVELDKVFNLPLGRAKGIDEELSKFANTGRYVEHFSKDDWQERLELFAPAMATLEDPDYMAIDDERRSYYRRVQLLPKQDPIVMKVVLDKNKEGQWFPLTWFNASKDGLEDMNRRLRKDKGKWLK